MMKVGVLVVLCACSSGSEQGIDEPQPAEDSGAWCIAALELAVQAELNLKAVQEQDLGADVPDRGALFDAFRETAPEDLSSAFEDFVSAGGMGGTSSSQVIEDRLDSECLLNDEAPPLSDQCEGGADMLVTAAADVLLDVDQAAEFASNCVPNDTPYPGLPPECEALVYAHFLDPELTAEDDEIIGRPSWRMAETYRSWCMSV